MRGKWAQGLEPRLFKWVIKGRLAGSERPGGYARNHRKIRRLEEIIWLSRNGFTHVISLLESPNNLRAYEEMDLVALQVPLAAPPFDIAGSLPVLYETIAGLLDEPGACVLLHQESFGDQLAGVFAGYLLYAGLIDEAPQATTIIERLLGLQMGSPGREIVALTVSDGLLRAGKPQPSGKPRRK